MTKRGSLIYCGYDGALRQRGKPTSGPLRRRGSTCTDQPGFAESSVLEPKWIKWTGICVSGQPCQLHVLMCAARLGKAMDFTTFQLERCNMNRFRGLIMGCTAAVALAFVAAAPADAGLFGHHAASCCAPAPCCDPAPVCCCPPPPVQVSWCVKDPCSCCTYEVSACVPACCAGEIPCLDGCRKGIFGRKILTYKFVGCGHCVDVVLTKHGRTIVRD